MMSPVGSFWNVSSSGRPGASVPACRECVVVGIDGNQADHRLADNRDEKAQADNTFDAFDFSQRFANARLHGASELLAEVS